MSPDLHGEEAVDAVEAAIAASVKRHMISDVPVGVFLSGGIDLPLVASEMVRQANAPFKTFSIGIPGNPLDETPEIIDIARQLKVENILQPVTEDSAFEFMDEVTKACSEPTADYSIFPTMMVSKLASQSVKVVLSGDGGDELFWGYPSRFASTLSQAKYFQYPKLARLPFIAGKKFGLK